MNLANTLTNFFVLGLLARLIAEDLGYARPFALRFRWVAYGAIIGEVAFIMLDWYHAGH